MHVNLYFNCTLFRKDVGNDIKTDRDGSVKLVGRSDIPNQILKFKILDHFLDFNSSITYRHIMINK
jgi:hypothetical protein